MEGATAELAERMLQTPRSDNNLRIRVETEHLIRRYAVWNRLNANQVLHFPRLDLNYLKELTISIYQLNFTPAYIRDKVAHDRSEIFELDEHRNEPGFIRVRLYSCF